MVDIDATPGNDGLHIGELEPMHWEVAGRWPAADSRLEASVNGRGVSGKVEHCTDGAAFAQHPRVDPADRSSAPVAAIR